MHLIVIDAVERKMLYDDHTRNARTSLAIPAPLGVLCRQRAAACGADVRSATDAAGQTAEHADGAGLHHAGLSAGLRDITTT